jgi:stalled ribosome rescue protein Dom34
MTNEELAKGIVDILSAEVENEHILPDVFNRVIELLNQMDKNIQISARCLLQSVGEELSESIPGFVHQPTDQDVMAELHIVSDSHNKDDFIEHLKKLEGLGSTCIVSMYINGQQQI